jgi:hypothetical protein
MAYTSEVDKNHLSGNSIEMDTHLRGNEYSDIGNCTADFVEGPLDTISSERQKRPIGHPEYIEDIKLRSNRDHLLSLLEANWDQVGWAFQKINKPTHVREALRILEPERDTFLIALLLRPTASKVPIQELRKMNDDWIDLGESIRIAREELFRYQKLVERAKGALAPPLDKEIPAMISDDHRDRISEILVELDGNLAKANELCTSKISERETLEEKLKDGFAYFARAELANFCAEKRYMRNPFNAANALAGLPYIGWRQSMKRCLDWKLEDLGSGRYMVVETISRIVNSCKRRSRLIDYTEQWLRDRLPKKSRIIVDLGENWYFLNQAIKSALRDDKITTQELPYRIAQMYFRMRMHPSPVDIILAEEMRIVP